MQKSHIKLVCTLSYFNDARSNCVDTAYRDLSAKGVRFTMPPSKQPWGGYLALFADPDGSIFCRDRMQAAQ